MRSGRTLGRVLRTGIVVLVMTGAAACGGSAEIDQSCTTALSSPSPSTTTVSPTPSPAPVTETVTETAADPPATSNAREMTITVVVPERTTEAAPPARATSECTPG